MDESNARLRRFFRPRWKPPMPLFVLEPPVHYAHHYNGPVIERVLTLAEAHKACAVRGVHADACAWTSNGACHLVIPKNGPVRDRSAYRRHELAHCNGWDHSHASTNSRDDLVEAYR
jgi:hypothetical protein